MNTIKRIRPTMFMLVLALCAGCGGGNTNSDTVYTPDDRGAARVLGTFAKSFGGALHDEPTTLAVAADGGLLIAGQMSRGASDNPQRTMPWLLRLDAAGDVLWQTGLFDPSSERNAQLVSEFTSRQSGYPRIVAALPDGGMLIAATSYHARTSYDVALMRIDADNRLVWMTHIDSGPWAAGYEYYPRERPDPPRDFPVAVHAAPGHGVYIVMRSDGDIIEMNRPGALAQMSAASVSVAFLSEAGALRWIAPRIRESVVPVGAAISPAGHLVLHVGHRVIEYAPDRVEIGRDEWRTSGGQFLQVAAGAQSAFDGFLGYASGAYTGTTRSIYKIDSDLDEGWRTDVDAPVTALRQICLRRTAERRCEVFFASRDAASPDTSRLSRLDEFGSLLDAPTCSVPGRVLDVSLLGSTTDPLGLRLLVKVPNRSLVQLQDVDFNCAPLSPEVPLAAPFDEPPYWSTVHPIARLLADGGAQIETSVFDREGALTFRASEDFGAGEYITSVALGADGESAALFADGRLTTLDATGFATRAYRLFDSPDPQAQLASDEQGRYWIAGANALYRVDGNGDVRRAAWETGLLPLQDRQLSIDADGVAYLQAQDAHARFTVTAQGLTMEIIATGAFRSSLLRNGDLALVTFNEESDRLGLQRVSSSGDLAWARVLRMPFSAGEEANGKGRGIVRDIAGTADGGLVLAFDVEQGWASLMGTRGDESLPASNDLALLKVDEHGQPQWLRVYGSTRDERWSRLAARGSRIAMVAASGSFDAVTPASRDWWVIGSGPDGRITYDTRTQREFCQACLGEITGDDLLNFVNTAGPTDAPASGYRETLAWETLPVVLQSPPQTALASANTARQCVGEATDEQESAARGGAQPSDFELRIATHGAVTSRIAGVGIDCGADCSERMAEGNPASLTAIPGAGERFIQWSGCDTVSELTCTVHMNRARNVDAFFGPSSVMPPPPSGGSLDLHFGVDGGAARLSVPELDCPSREVCTVRYPAGVAVRITADVGTGFRIDTWVGCDSYSRTECIVIMNRSRSVVAYGSERTSGQVQLHVARAGAGSGDIQGLRCLRDYGCSGSFAPGEPVTLTAVADAGSVFHGWIGCPTLGAFGTCTLSPNEDQFLTARFARPGEARLTVLRTGANSGAVRITSDRTGIDCGVDCTEDYPEYTTVRLTASGVSIPPAQWRNCSFVQSDGSCDVELMSDRTVELSIP